MRLQWSYETNLSSSNLHEYWIKNSTHTFSVGTYSSSADTFTVLSTLNEITLQAQKHTKETRDVWKKKPVLSDNSLTLIVVWTLLVVFFYSCEEERIM